MIQRLHAPVRLFTSFNRLRHSSTKTPDALNILFCGSDEFSIASLRALYKAKHEDHSNIRSIEVVHRPGKRTGRGLKVIREVPIKQVAQGELQLKTHEIDTFTGWTPPSPTDLVIAVSFGLFIPPRILNGAKYGGLNVHPSLLPDLRGPAPIHHTLLKQRSKTGITIQTLHPEHFDRGQILAQTPAPGLDVPEDATTADLIASLGEQGGEMLVDLLKSQAYIPPLQDAGWYGSSSGPVSYAEKLTKTHSYIDLSAASADDIITRHRALGDLWCYLSPQRSGERVILHKIQQTSVVDTTPREPGFIVLEGLIGVGIKTADGSVLDVTSCTVSGGTKKQGIAKIKRFLT